MFEQVILVDKNDEQVGTKEKLAAHREGKLHRAFSIFLFNPQNKMLLQERSREKYHSGGLWANACCGHPRPGEKTQDAAARRLNEEMGITCPLRREFHFIYRSYVGKGLVENEYDHVFVGQFDGTVVPRPSEVSAYRWMTVGELQRNMHRYPEKYAPWFKIALKGVLRAQP